MPQQKPEDWTELEAVLRRELEIQKVRTQAIEEMIASLRLLHGPEAAPANLDVPDNVAPAVPTVLAMPGAPPAAHSVPFALPLDHLDHPPVKLPTGGPDVGPIAGAILATGAARRASDAQPAEAREVTARLDRRSLRAGHVRERAERAARRAVAPSGFGVVTAGAAVALGAAAMFLALPHSPRVSAPVGPRVALSANAEPAAPAMSAQKLNPPNTSPTRLVVAKLPPDLNRPAVRVRQPDRWVPRDEPAVEITPAAVRPAALQAARMKRGAARTVAIAVRPAHPARKSTVPRSALRRHAPVVVAARPTLASPVGASGSEASRDVERDAPMPAPVQAADMLPTARGGDGSDDESARFGIGGGGSAAAGRTSQRIGMDTGRARRPVTAKRPRVAAPLSYGNFGDDMPGERLGR